MIQHAIELLLILVSIVVAIPVTVVFVETSAAMFGKQRLNAHEVAGLAASRPACGILMPAHNEAAVIEETLRSLIPHLRSNDQVIVVADNCSDETARLASHFPVRVEERANLEQRGKGYALAHGLQQWGETVPEVVVIMDADCWMEQGGLDRIVSVAAEKQRPAQALYLMESPPQPGPKDQISAFAFLFKNLVRPLGLHILGQPCLLTGTGMAFPRALISPQQLATGNIVEDMQLGLDLSIAGHPPVLVPDARIWGRLPAQAAAAASQRTRWEHGHIQTLFSNTPRLLWHSIAGLRLDLFSLAAELCVPPLALLCAGWFSLFVVTLILEVYTQQFTATMLIVSSGLILGAAVLLAWFAFGRKVLSGSVLLRVPIYVIAKVPLYFRFLSRRQKMWIRTERDQKHH